MDKKQIVVIATTALVTWTVTKGASWLFTIAKTAATISTTKTKVKTIFNKTNRTIMFDFIWLGAVFALLWHNIFETSPVTRFSVFDISLLVLVINFWILKICYDFAAWRHNR